MAPAMNAISIIFKKFFSPILMYDKRWTVEFNVSLCLETQGLCSKSLNCIRRFYTSTQYVKYKLSSNNGDYERQKKRQRERKNQPWSQALSLSLLSDKHHFVLRKNGGCSWSIWCDKSFRRSKNQKNGLKNSHLNQEKDACIVISH